MRAGLEGFGEQYIGIIMAGYYIGLIVGTFIASRVIRAVGYVRSFAAFASIASATAFAHVLVIDPVIWFLFRLNFGICLAVMEVVAESWLNASASNTNRGRILSLYSIVFLASMGLGQPLIGRFSPATFEIFGISTIIVSLCLIPVTLARVQDTHKIQRRPPQILKTFLRSPFAGIGVMLSGLLYGGGWSLVPRYAQQIGVSEKEIGIVMLLISLGTLTLQWPLGYISDKHSRRSAIFISSGVSFAVLLLIGVTQATVPLLYLLIFLFGGFGMPLYSLCISLVNDQLEPEEMVHAAGALLLFYGIGSSTGPILGGAIMARIGPPGLFYSMAVPLGIYLFFALIQGIRFFFLPEGVKKVREHRRARYQPYPRTTTTIFSLLRNRKSGDKPDQSNEK
jgi:MFS family permease